MKISFKAWALALLVLLLPALHLIAQSEQAPAPKSLPLTVYAPGTTAKVTGTTSESNLTEQQRRGEGLFMQRCSLCHFPQLESHRRFGPDLSGVLAGVSPDEEKAFRTFIGNGVPGKMPGFQYGLSAKQFDDLISFLKVF